MAVLKKVGQVFVGILAAVGKLLYTLVKLTLSLFLLVLQLFLAIFHAGSRD
ncbi:MAG: hypothetical protein ACK5MN_02855 [Lachnospiraceae bacterium]